MRAVQLVRRGAGPAGLAVVDIAVPSVAANELLVQVHAVSASKLELEQTMAGVGLGRAVQLPRVLGMDPAGLVVAQGTEVTGDRVGTRVAVKPNLVCGECRYCRSGAESDCLHQRLLGVHRDGGAAEFVAVPAGSAFPIPDGLDFLSAAAAVHTVAVALHLLDRAGRPEEGDAVLVLGASGAVGSAAVQLAARRGAAVIAAVSGAGPVERAVEDGASFVVDSRAVGDLGAAVRARVPDGVAAVVDTTGNGALFTASIDSLGWAGVAVTCSGQAGEQADIELGALYRSRRSVVGVAGTDFRNVRDALQAVADRQVTVRVRATRPLAQAQVAYELLAERGNSGKVMLIGAD